MVIVLKKKNTRQQAKNGVTYANPHLIKLTQPNYNDSSLSGIDDCLLICLILCPKNFVWRVSERGAPGNGWTEEWGALCLWLGPTDHCQPSRGRVVAESFFLWLSVGMALSPERVRIFCTLLGDVSCRQGVVQYYRHTSEIFCSRPS